jgi:N-acetylneuraminate synthase
MNIKGSDIFKNLFVLEMANNHWGSLIRGKKIINDHAQIVKFNGVRAAIKLQFRDIKSFIHVHHKDDTDQRYIKKTQDTRMSKKDLFTLVKEVRKVNCIPMSTPFDEKSVDLCEEFDLPIIKIASSDVNDWPLLERISKANKPTIISTGGVNEKDLDDVVEFFNNRKIPLAINHCVSLYPSEDQDLCLSQIDYFKKRYKDNVIGLSTHEYHDWSSSVIMSYAKGARTWERHIDINYEGVPVSKYCSLPEQCDIWFKSYKKALEMNGSASDERRIIKKEEIEYLDKLVRGVYAKKNLLPGYKLHSKKLKEDFYLAIPLKKGQLSCRELLNGEKITKAVKKNEPLTIDNIDGPYKNNKKLRELIKNRGI